MKKSKKSIVDKYHNDIYEIEIIVANKYTTLEQLRKKYVYYDGVILDDGIKDTTACVCRCKDIKTGEHCLVVKFNIDYTNDASFLGTINHEATHVALDIYELIEQRVDFSSSEPFCYLVEWATRCIYKTLIK